MHVVSSNIFTDMDMEAIPQLGFTEALNNATSKIFQFSGRSRRSEYWWTMFVVYLLNVVITPLLGIFLSIATIPLTFRRLHDTGRSGWWWGVGALMQLAFFVFLFFDFVAAILDDDDTYSNPDSVLFSVFMKYGIWLLVIGIYKIVLLVFMCQDSDPDINEYGESPKYQDAMDGQQQLV